MKTKAAVAWEPNHPLEIEEIELEAPRDGEVLVRVHATGVGLLLMGSVKTGRCCGNTRASGQRTPIEELGQKGRAVSVCAQPYGTAAWSFQPGG